MHSKRKIFRAAPLKKGCHNSPNTQFNLTSDLKTFHAALTAVLLIENFYALTTVLYISYSSLKRWGELQQLFHTLQVRVTCRQVQILLTKNKDSRVQKKMPPFSDSSVNNKRYKTDLCYKF